MSEVFEKDEIEPEPIDQPETPKERVNFSNLKEFIEWLLNTIGSAKLAHEVLFRYASTFKLREGKKRCILYLVMVPVSFLIDTAAAFVLWVMVFILLLGMGIALLRGLNVIPELLSIYNSFV